MAQTERDEEFVSLFTSHERRLRALALSLVPNFADADDILQQSNLVIWKKFAEYEAGTNFMSWAGSIVYYTALQHRRKKAREKIHFGTAFFDAMASVAARSDVNLQLCDEERALAECIAQLRPDHREMLQSRYSEGGSIEQMALRFGRTADAIHSVLKRIRRALQTCVSYKTRSSY